MAEFLKHYRVLLNKARVDLKAATNLYGDIKKGDTELDYEVVLFHLHQCAEKFMKSILAFHEIDYPKIHDLENLASLLDKRHIQTGLDIELLVELSDYAVEGRYAFLQEETGDIEKYITMLTKALSGHSK
jgi:HEPN domain-containing protein